MIQIIVIQLCTFLDSQHKSHMYNGLQNGLQSLSGLQSFCKLSTFEVKSDKKEAKSKDVGYTHSNSVFKLITQALKTLFSHYKNSFER